MYDKKDVSVFEVPEIMKMISEHIPSNQLSGILRLNRVNRFIFKSTLNTRQFLQHVVEGRYEEVKRMLNDNPHFLYTRGQVMDFSGRAFKNISGFEYALWALDEHQWKMMLDCLPRNEKGKEIVEKLRCQYHKVATKGVTYKLNGATITEKHFDFKIIKELKTQVDLQRAYGDKDGGALKQWKEDVGGAQKLLPMHVVYEYCSDVSFHPKPDFESQPKSSMQFYNWIDDKYENWFSGYSRLGDDFAIYKAWARRLGRVVGVGWSAGEGACVVADLDALTALCEVRTNGFINLETHLCEKLMAVDNQPQVFQI